MDKIPGRFSDDLRWLIRSAARLQLASGEAPPPEHGPDRAVYVVLAGVLRLRYRDGERRAGPGLVVDGAEDAPLEVEAVESAVLLALPRARLAERAEAHPGLLERLRRGAARVPPDAVPPRESAVEAGPRMSDEEIYRLVERMIRGDL